VLAGWMAVLDGRTAEAQQWAAIIDAASFDQVPVDGTASFASSRAMLRSFMCDRGPEQALADANVAIAEEPPWSPWRSQALSICGEAHLLAGDVDGATSLFDEANDVAARNSESDAFVLSASHLALLEMDTGQWAEAADHIEGSLARIDASRMDDYVTSVLAFAGAARLALHRGDLNGVHRELTRAMRARPSCTLVVPNIAVRVRLQLARVYAAIADQASARHLLREVDDILHARPAMGTLVEEVSELRLSLTSSIPAGASGGSPLTPAELRLLPYLQTHLTIREIAERLYVSRNTASTQVSSIYRKLGVSSRYEAVQQATTVGLLGE
jgi:LuxR family transcriptional regulator, maltose regulon positive regulatory protein